MTMYIVIIPIFFIIIAIISIINICCKTLICITLAQKETREAINLNYSILGANGWQCKALVLLDSGFKGYLSGGNTDELTDFFVSSFPFEYRS